MRVLYVVTLLVVFNSIWSCNTAESGCAVERGTAKATAGFLTAPQLAEVDFVGPISALLRSRPIAILPRQISSIQLL
jgi:hypothetical protein